jgi:hypothetical protein
VSNIEENQLGQLSPAVGGSVTLNAHVALNVDCSAKAGLFNAIY